MSKDQLTRRVSPLPVDLARTTMGLAGAFLYLDVPITQSLISALTLVLQAGIGTYLVSRLMGTFQWSILFFLGPGLVVGGAASVAIFQVTGRGSLGLFSSAFMGLLSVIALIRGPRKTGESGGQFTLWLHLFGATAFILSSEFEWLLPVAGGFVLTGLVLRSRRLDRHLYAILILSCLAVVLFASLRTRGQWWWLITDDYMFFEVLSRHVAVAGPLEPWGSISFARYHWLSYGWSGLLALTIPTPEVLVTLTRVMPLVYSIALASSLLLIVTKIQRSDWQTWKNILPLWVVLAVTRLDWSGLSTAGVYAVLATLVSLAVIVLVDEVSLKRRTLLYLLLAGITTLTKFPSVLVFPAVLLAIETSIYLKIRRSAAWLQPAIVVVVACVVTLATLPALSKIFGLVSIAFPNANLGEIANHGAVFAVIGLLIRSAWLFVALLMTWMATFRLLNSQGSEVARFLLCLTPMYLLGIAMDVLTTGNANTHEYFSGPQYFVSTICFLGLGKLLASVKLPEHDAQKTSYWLLLLIFLLLWNWLSKEIDLPGWLDRSVLRQALGDYRLLFGILLILVIAARTRHRMHLVLPITCFLGLLILPFILAAADPESYHIPREHLNRKEVSQFLGSPDAEAVGLWLKRNTQSRSLIATNYLRHPGTGEFLDDFSLAMWSEREFLVIGPKFSESFSDIGILVGLSERFGYSPESADLQELLNLGVRWFVIEVGQTSRREWSTFGEIVLKTEQFWVLKLRDFDHS